MVKYTLDCIENGQYVFVEKGNEENSLTLATEKITTEIVEGDIVDITENDSVYTFEKIEEDASFRKEDVQSLIDKLKKK